MNRYTLFNYGVLPVIAAIRQDGTRGFRNYKLRKKREKCVTGHHHGLLLLQEAQGLLAPGIDVNSAARHNAVMEIGFLLGHDLQNPLVQTGRQEGQVLHAGLTMIQQAFQAVMVPGQPCPDINNINAAMISIQLAGQRLNLLDATFPQIQEWISPQARREFAESATQTVSESVTGATQTNEPGQLCEGSSQTHQELEFVMHESSNLEPVSTVDRSLQPVEGEVEADCEAGLPANSSASDGSSPQSESTEDVPVRAPSSQDLADPLDVDADIVPRVAQPTSTKPAVVDATVSAAPIETDAVEASPALANPVDGDPKLIQRSEGAESTFEEVPAPAGFPQDLVTDSLEVDEVIVPAEAQSSSTEPAPPVDVVGAPVAADPAEATLVAAAPIDATPATVAPINAKEANGEAEDRQDSAEVPQSSSSDVAVPGRRSERGAAQLARGKIADGVKASEEEVDMEASLPKKRVAKGYSRRGRPSNKDRAANVDAASAGAAPAADAAKAVDVAPVGTAPILAAAANATPAVGAPAVVTAPVTNGNGAPRRARPKNGASESVQVRRRAMRRAIQQREPLEEGTDEYQALLQEARTHHAECPIFKDPELGQLTNLNLFNPNKRSTAMPQEVGSKTIMAKGLFLNYLKVVKKVAPEEAWSSLSPTDRQKWEGHEDAVFEESLEQLRRGFIRTPGSRSRAGRRNAAGEMEEDEDAMDEADEDGADGAGAVADEMGAEADDIEDSEDEEPAVKRPRTDN
ncbi:unnamed protein product [Caenorhabditis nigoni]